MTDHNPPLGLKPRWLADEHRLADVDAALERYKEAGMIPPSEWLDERRDLVRSLLQHRPTDPALAQPEPVGPTERIVSIAKAVQECAFAWAPTARLIGNVCAEDVADLCAAVLARWGHPTIEPEPEGPPQGGAIALLEQLRAGPDDHKDYEKYEDGWIDACNAAIDALLVAQPEPEGPTARAELAMVANEMEAADG